MLKSILMWFISPIKVYKTNKEIDAFIYRLIDAVKSGSKFYATDDGVLVYHIEVNGVGYSLWGDNKYYAYLSEGWTGDDIDRDYLWVDQMPSRKVMYDFIRTVKKYCTPPEKPQYKDETRKRLANLP